MVWIALGAVCLYIVVGLAVIIYFDCYAGWPDAGQAMPLGGCLVGLLFYPSFLLYLGGCKVLHVLRGRPPAD